MALEALSKVLTTTANTLQHQEKMDQHQYTPRLDQKGNNRARADILNVTKALEDRRRLLQRLRRPARPLALARYGGSTNRQKEPNRHTFFRNPRKSEDDTIDPPSYEECSDGNLPEQRTHSGDHLRSPDDHFLTRFDASESFKYLSTGRNSSASFGSISRPSLLPSPLNLEKVKKDTRGPTQSNWPPTRAYGGAQSKIREHFGANDVQMDLNFVEQPSPTVAQSDILPRPPPKTWRSSVQRVSLTPSEMPYPMHLIRKHDSTDHRKAEEMLGLRRHSYAPPLPPKDQKWSFESTSTGSISLPLYGGPLPDRVPEPLNGRTAKLHALTAMLIVFNTWGLCNAFGLFQAYYARDYLSGSSPSTISWIGSVQLASVFGLGVPVGRLVDRGYFRAVFHGGTALLVLGIFCSAACTKFWQLLLVQGFITGLGMGMVVCAGIVALMTWWDEWKIGRAMGLAAAGSCLGGITYVALARHFLRTSGLNTTMLVIGGFVTVGMIPPNIVFRMRGQRDRPTATKKQTNLSHRSAYNWRTFASAPYLLATGGLFFSFLGVYFGFVYIISYASTELHLFDTASTNLLIFMLAANLTGRFLPALISDRCIGPLNTLIPSVLLSSAIIWLWAVSSDNRSSLTVIACFYGFASAGIQVLYAPTVYTFCLEPARSNSSTEETQLAVDRIGLKAGVVFSAIGVGCLIGLPIGGALITYRTSRGMSQPYLGAQIFAGVCLLLGGFLLLGSRVAKAGWAARRA